MQFTEEIDDLVATRVTEPDEDFHLRSKFGELREEEEEEEYRERQSEEINEEGEENEYHLSSETFKDAEMFSGRPQPEAPQTQHIQQAPAQHRRPYIFPMPDVVRQFVSYFDRYIKEKNVPEIQSMYESSFSKISEKYFKNSSWPSAELIAPIVNNDRLFLILYKELYYRHIFTNMLPTLDHHFDSWENYCELFNFLLNARQDLSLELPKQWLWDMIDEFIYQFQAFHQYRSKVKSKGQEEITALKNNPQVWNITTVIQYLQSLINKSNVIPLLERQKKKGILDPNVSSETLGFSVHPLFYYIGCFAIIGLLRLQVLLGDYYLAAKTISCIDLFNKRMFVQVAPCNVNLYYYAGFLFMMMRRFVDAIKAFSFVLVYINRKKQIYTRFYHYDRIAKISEQIYGLLAICLSLCPQRVEESIQATLRDNYGEKMAKLQRGEELAFEELFLYSCPEFVSPSPFNYALLEDPKSHNAANYHQDLMRLQMKLFLNSIKHQTLVPTIRNYLKLYSTIPVEKLASFLEMDEKTLRVYLMCYKQYTKTFLWNGGSPLNGEWVLASDVDFYIDKDMIHVIDNKSQRRYTDLFIREIGKFDEIIAELQKFK